MTRSMHQAAASSSISPGLLRWPGATAQSRAEALRIILNDTKEHHCYFTPRGLHDHLTHHILAAYDLGAPPSLLKKIEADHLPFQRDIHIDKDKEPAHIDESSWTSYLGQTEAFAPYVTFFLEQIQQQGILATVEAYLCGPEANDDQNRMLARVTCSVLHPMIVLGYGVEFKSDAMAAWGLAMTAIAPERPPSLFPKHWPPAQSNGSIDGKGKLPLFGVLRELYESDLLAPTQPYDPDALVSKRATDATEGERGAEIERIASKWNLNWHGDDRHFDAKVEECIWFAALVFGGAGQRGKSPRLDFFLMHLVTSSIFLSPFMDLLRKPEQKAALLATWLRMSLLTILTRGRPRIDAALLMSYSATPAPPKSSAPAIDPGPKAVGDNVAEDQNPWIDVVKFGLRCSDWHLAKVLRMLLYADRAYGTYTAGQVPGCEAIEGLQGVDGTIFIRIAGVAMDIMGWNSTKTGDGGWDRSALGYSEAWDSEEAQPFDMSILEPRLRNLVFSNAAST